jgi:hypothetical protein
MAASIWKRCESAVNWLTGAEIHARASGQAVENQGIAGGEAGAFAV